MPGTNIRVRIAPSPTGFAHVGTAYTALFNYAFAKKNKGKFVIRLEDTDVMRHVKGAEKAVYDGLSWLGLAWDEGPGKGGKYGPYRQSERLDIYRGRVQELIKKDLAYEDEGSVRFRNPGKDISWNDLIRGKVSFPGGEVTDFVLLKSDGYPTYNFAVVVDDILMKISHVIRGEEHISNTPRQLALYKALKTDPPKFAHLPTLRNKERKKLSKRRDPVDLKFFQEQGYLPEALINFLCLLGWSHPEGKEKFPIKEFIDNFDFKRIRKAGPIFDMDKLNWLNKQYLTELDPQKFVTYVSTASIYKDRPNFETITAGTALVVQPRVNNISQYDSLVEPIYVEPKVKKSLLGKSYKDHISSALETLKSVDWNKKSIGKDLLSVVKENGFNTGDFFMDLRIALTGKRVTMPMEGLIKELGRKVMLKRLKELLD